MDTPVNDIPRVVNGWIDGLEYPARPAGLYEPIRYMLSSGGKRLRPTLLCLAAMAGGAAPESCRERALGIEMYHNFTLLHDDVMDNSSTRHGRPTVHCRWDVATAILSGDMMLTWATRLMDAPGANRDKVMELFLTTAAEVYEGQQYDMDYEKTAGVTAPMYLEMIRLKTSVLLAAACALGALTASMSHDEVKAFYCYGEALGLAFQLRDDYLDTYGDPMTFGKPIGGDILNRKNTWLRVECNAAAPGELARLESTLDGEALVDAVRSLYNSLELPSRCMELIREYTHRAIACLDGVAMADSCRVAFNQLATSAITREK